MVSLWPWKGVDSSPASFERALSILSARISKQTAQLETLRQRSRRLKGLWTLYAGFAYILYTVVLGLVLGWRNWGTKEYTAVAGGPVLIYLVRLLLRTYYDYRIVTVTERLEEVQKEREKTIEKLKAATKYNSTQQLLEKYGGSPSQLPSSSAGSSHKRKSGRVPDRPATPKGSQTRINIIPPPTANIPRHNPSTPLPSALQQRTSSPATPLRQLTLPSQSDLLPSSPLQPGPPEFAPNAFSGPPQYLPDRESSQSRWYDRLLDVLLGEDETLPKNRLALICTHCKLVNGQAPPGTKRLEDVGRWRCGGCGGWNGQDDEARKLVNDIQQQTHAQRRESNEDSGDEDDDQESPVEEEEDEDGEGEGEGEMIPPTVHTSPIKLEQYEEPDEEDLPPPQPSTTTIAPSKPHKKPRAKGNTNVTNKKKKG